MCEENGKTATLLHSQDSLPPPKKKQRQMLVASSGDKMIYQKYLESFEMRCCRRVEKISWTDRVRNDEVLRRAKEQRNILYAIKRGMANCIGHIWFRNCLLKHVIEWKVQGRIEVKGRRGRRRKQLPDDLVEKGEYCKLKEEALDRALWRTRFGRGCGPVLRQTT